MRLLGASHELLLTTPVSDQALAPDQHLFTLEGWLHLPAGYHPPHEPLLHRMGQMPRLAVVNSHAHALEATRASLTPTLTLSPTLSPTPTPTPVSFTHLTLPTIFRVLVSGGALSIKKKKKK